MTNPSQSDGGSSKFHALLERTGMNFGGWQQLLAAVIFLAVAVVVNLHFLPSWALLAPAVLLAMTTFGAQRGLILSLVTTVVLAPAFQPLLLPVSTVLVGLVACYRITRRKNIIIGLFAGAAWAMGYVGFAYVLMRYLLPVLHYCTLYAWTLLPTYLVAAITGYFAYRYVRSSHSGENWASLGLAALLGATWFAVPLVVFLIAGKQYKSGAQFLPAIGTLVIAVVCTLAVFVKTWRSARNDGRNRFVALLKVTGLGLLWSVLPFTVFASTNEQFVTLQMRMSVKPEYVELKDLPFTVNDRILPRSTAELYVQNANSESNFTTEKPHIQFKDGKMYWQSPLHDKRWFGRLFGAVSQVIRVDSDKKEFHKEATSNSEFRFGNDSWVVKAAFMARHPFSEIAESAYYHKDDGSWVLLISHVSKRPSWTGTMMHSLAGVMEVDQSGVITDYNVKQATVAFPGAAFYPAALQRQYADAYCQWRQGWWTTWVGQSGILEVSEDHDDDPTFNRAPYIIGVEKWGLQGVLALEPHGDTQFAAVEHLFFDSSTGYVRACVTPEDLELVGPRRCMGQIRSSDDRSDWSQRDNIEPRFVNSPRGIFYLVCIVTKDSADKTRNQNYISSVLIDAATLDAYKFTYSDEIRSFLAQPRPADAHEHKEQK